MAKDDELEKYRTGPPADETAWQKMHRAADRADQTWLVSKPIVAVVGNWRALAVIMAIVLYLNNPKIIAALRVLAGEGQ